MAKKFFHGVIYPNYANGIKMRVDYDQTGAADLQSLPKTASPKN